MAGMKKVYEDPIIINLYKVRSIIDLRKLQLTSAKNVMGIIAELESGKKRNR
jgi:hypothetical protein